MHWRNGKVNNIPICCRLNYILDSVCGIKSGLLRSFNNSGEYVPCWFHHLKGLCSGNKPSWVFAGLAFKKKG